MIPNHVSQYEIRIHTYIENRKPNTILRKALKYELQILTKFKYHKPIITNHNYNVGQITKSNIYTDIIYFFNKLSLQNRSDPKQELYIFLYI